MFDGRMPPAGLAGAAKDTAAQVQMVPLGAGLAVPTDGAVVGVVEKSWATVAPRVLVLGFPAGGITPGFVFPPAPVLPIGVPAGFDAGLLTQAGSAFGGGTSRKAACVLEYGIGSATQKVYFDWKPGAYNVPACEWARVSVLAWGTTWAAGSFPAAASLATGQLQDAFPPTVSATGALIAGNTSFSVPGNARGVEVLNEDSTTTPVITLSWGPVGKFAVRDYATPLFLPGWTPLDVELPGATLQVTSDVATLARIVWTLSL